MKKEEDLSQQAFSQIKESLVIKQGKQEYIAKDTTWSNILQGFWLIFTFDIFLHQKDIDVF